MCNVDAATATANCKTNLQKILLKKASSYLNFTIGLEFKPFHRQ